MPTVQPIAADDKTAAKLLSMSRTRFLELVEAGCLPAGRQIAPGEVRWYVPDLEAIVKGQPREGFEW